MTRGRRWHNQSMYGIEYFCDPDEDAKYIRAKLILKVGEEFASPPVAIWLEIFEDNICLRSANKERLEFGIKRFEEEYEKSIGKIR